jgi:hypothetical protein
MAKQRVVNTRFWDDDYVMELTPSGKLLFLYFLTNPLTDLCGAYQIALKRIAFDTGLEAAEIRGILGQFEADGKIIYRKGWLVIRNFAKHQSGTSPKIAKGVERSLSGCPDWVKDMVLIGYDTLSPETTLLPEPVGQPEPIGIPSEGSRERENPPPEKPKASDFGARQQIPKDPNFLHPAIKHLREMTGHDPPKESKPLLIAALGTDFDVGRLAECYARWRAANYKASNFNFVLDWYKNGIPEKNNGKNNGHNGTGKRTDADVKRESEEFIKKKFDLA